MILPIILLILIVLIISLLIAFLFYVFFPSIKIDEKFKDDPIIPGNKKNYLISEDVYFEKNENRAVVLCSCNKTLSLKHTKFNESYTCFMVKNSLGTGSDCPFACIGLGDCMKICPQMAIIIENNTALVTDNCCGCGKCIEVCPQGIIQLIPKNSTKIQLCSCKENELTSCSKFLSEGNIEWKVKKDFKLWSYCYKLIRRLFK